MKSVAANLFLNTIATNVHTSWDGMSDTDANYVINALNYTGINTVREDVIPEAGNTGAYSRLDALAKAGIKFDFMINPDWKDNLSGAVKNLHDFAVSHPGTITAIEGCNEVDLWPFGDYKGQTGTAAVRAFQQDFFNMINADAALKDIPVYSFTYSDPTVKIGNMSGMADVAASHNYQMGPNLEPLNLPSQMAGTRTDQGISRLAITETGLFTGSYSDGWMEGVDQNTHAKMSLNTIFEAARNGAEKTYQFELTDLNATEKYKYGMYNADHTPKVQARVMHDLHSILGDSGTAASHDIPVSVSGLPSTGHTYLMEKTDGSFDLAVYNLADTWDDTRQQPTASPLVPTTINLGATYASVKVFDPMVGTTPINTYSNVSSLQVQTPDHPLIVQLSGAGTSGGAPTPAPTPTPNPPPSNSTPTETSHVSVGSGSKLARYYLSGDHYNGDPQYTVKVDGKQIGGTFTAKAVHGTNQHDVLDVNLGYGSHKVVVTFTNDAWAGTPQTDRNLYVDDVIYRGSDLHISGTMLSTGNHFDHVFN